MIFEIHKATETNHVVFKEVTSKPYQAWDALKLMRDCGFINVFICCFAGYENALIFTHA